MVRIIHVLSVFLRLFFQRLNIYSFLTIALSLLFSAQSIAKTVYFPTDSPTTTFPTAQLACNYYIGWTRYDGVKAVTTSIRSSTECNLFNAGGDYFAARGYDSREEIEDECYKDPPGPIVIVWFGKTEPTPITKCDPLGSGYCKIDCSGSPKINYPNNANVVCHYSSKTPVSSCIPQWDGVCNPDDPYGGCYTPPNDGCTRQPNGSIVCPPDVPPPTPDPKCDYGATNAYCVPQNGACPKGYVPGNYNGQSICVKNSHEEPDCPKDSYGNYNCAGDPDDPNDPNDPNNPPNNPNDPNNGGCTSNCNNTTNNNYNTYNNTTNNITNNEAPKVDFSAVIAKLEEVKTGVAAVDSSVKALATSVKAVENAVNASSEKITLAVDKTTSAVKSGFETMGEKLGLIDKSVKDGTQQAKEDAEKQLKATEDQTKQDKEYQDWQKLTHECKAVTPPVTPEDFNNGSGAGDFINNTPASGGNPSQVNMKLCKFVDSFEDYKKWMNGTDKPGNTVQDQIDKNAAPGMPWGTLTLPNIDTNKVHWNQQCPADRHVEIMGHDYFFSYSMLCEAFIKASFWVRAFAWLSAAMILLGAVRR